MARETGLEPATSGVTGRRSNQLSYSPEGRRGISQSRGQVNTEARVLEQAEAASRARVRIG